MNKFNLSIGILAWHSPKTLRATLSSYKEAGLLDLANDTTIFFQEVTKEDLELAGEFGVNTIQSTTNVGIGPAIKSLMDTAQTENVLTLEEDWIILPENCKYCYSVITGALYELECDDQFDFIRLRSEKDYGWPLYTLQFKDREMDSPEHLIEAVHHAGLGLVKKYPDKVKYKNNYVTEFVYCDSYYGNYSNNPFMCKKGFWLNNVYGADRGGISLEGEIRKTWREAGHTVAYNVPGLFTHSRLDR